MSGRKPLPSAPSGSFPRLNIHATSRSPCCIPTESLIWRVTFTLFSRSDSSTDRELSGYAVWSKSIVGAEESTVIEVPVFSDEMADPGAFTTFVVISITGYTGGLLGRVRSTVHEPSSPSKEASLTGVEP